MKQTIRLTEQELHNLIRESVEQMLNEECDEKFLGGLRDSLGAMKDTFLKGGGYAAHKANRNLQTARTDIANLQQKYGREGFSGNDSQWRKEMTQDQIDANNATMEEKIAGLEQQKQMAMQQIAQKFDSKIKDLKDKYDLKNDKIQARAQKNIDSYRQQKSELDARRDTAYNNRRSAMKQNPYADFQ